MREIKLRAWAIDHEASTENHIVKRMFHNVCLEFSDSKWFVMVRGMQRTEEEGHYWFGFDTKLMQYTGINDKNGVEIYEGDVVTRVGGGLLGSPTQNLFTGEVVFTKHGYKARYVSDSPGSGGARTEENYGNLFNQSELEVIGNIYENPKLLK